MFIEEILSNVKEISPKIPFVQGPVKLPWGVAHGVVKVSFDNGNSVIIEESTPKTIVVTVELSEDSPLAPEVTQWELENDTAAAEIWDIFHDFGQPRDLGELMQDWKIAEDWCSVDTDIIDVDLDGNHSASIMLHRDHDDITIPEKLSIIVHEHDTEDMWVVDEKIIFVDDEEDVRDQITGIIAAYAE